MILLQIEGETNFASNARGPPARPFRPSVVLCLLGKIPNPLEHNFVVAARSCGTLFKKTTDFGFVHFLKMKKEPVRTPEKFSSVRIGAFNVPVPAAVSGQLHFPFSQHHIGMQYSPAR